MGQTSHSDRIPVRIIKDNDAKHYSFGRAITEDELLRIAGEILMEKVKRVSMLCAPGKAKEFLCVQLGACEREVFACIWLDTRHRVIDYEELFFGTIDGSTVYPREIVKSALKHNAAAVVAAHCHPSGVAEPSSADKAITRRLKDALALVDIRLLDHIVVGGADSVSFAERGIL